MTAPVFVDTNVLLYAVDTGDEKKHRAASAWCLELWKTRRGRVSYQVLQEFYVQAVRKRPQSADAAAAEVRDFAWDPVVVDASVIEAAWRIQERFKLSFWDALIVGAAQAAGCPHLLTEDPSHGQDIDGVRVVSPFRVAPTDLDVSP